ncbi:MAG TPA: hypothetical protein DCL44_07280 [Elusimicrobia bacterium]|nr:hypothetical protein [Elusimicrobiota bacterium]
MGELTTGAVETGQEKLKSLETDSLVMLARNPASVFVFWQFNPHKAAAFRDGSYAPEIKIRLFYAEDKTPAGEAAFAWDSLKAYLKPPLEGRVYFAALYGVKPDGACEKLLDSNSVTLPVSSPLAAGSTYSSAEFMKKALP